MRIGKLLLALSVVSALAVLPSQAQQGAQLAGAQVVAACGTPPSTYTAGQVRPILQDTDGLECVSASVTVGDVDITELGGQAINLGNGTVGAGTLRVTIASNSTGTVAATQSGTWTVQPGNTPNTSPWLVTNTASAAGGCTPGKVLSAASTNATSVKGSAGTLCKLTAINTTATLYYLKFYNVASGPACNTDAVVATYPVPASTTGAGVSVNLGPYGEAYSTGIGFCLTGALADNDNTNAATGVVISYSYK